MPNAPKTHAQRLREAQPRPKDARPHSADRGYGHYWRKIRAIQLSREPLCRMCKANGRTEAATMVDHIKPKSQGGSDMADNLQSLCWDHHNQKTRREGK